MCRSLIAALCGALLTVVVTADELPPGYWPPERTPEVLDLTKTIRLAPTLTDLTPGERRALQELIEAGKLIQRIYEDSLHPQALEAHDTLVQLNIKLTQAQETQALLDLYRLFKGPIATTPDNRREPFLPVLPETPARNIYPLDSNRGEIEFFIERHPQERDALLAARTVVRRATPENLKRDLEVLTRYPALDVLHPGLKRKLDTLRTAADTSQLYALPYAVRWAPEIMRIYQRLHNAARALETSDEEFARFLRNRARDLLSNDYESGDAAWVTGEFKRLNAQIGAYETHDDVQFGVKAFMSMSLLKRDAATTKQLRALARNLQTIEDALPTPQRRTVNDIAIGAYEVIADFGHSRGCETAAALPTDPLFTKRYGRTVILRTNILRHPELFANQHISWKALMASPFDGDLTVDGELYRALWHAVGHYLGVDHDRHGRPLPIALQSVAGIYEELKADLIALFVATLLHRAGSYSEHDMVTVYASGIQRLLPEVRPRREQLEQTAQLIQFNWFHEHGVLYLEPATDSLMLRYDRYHAAVAELLETVLKIQHDGDRAAADAFLERWTTWTDALHEPIAKRVRESRQFRYVLFKYGILGE